MFCHLCRGGCVHTCASIYMYQTLVLLIWMSSKNEEFGVNRYVGPSSYFRRKICLTSLIIMVQASFISYLKEWPWISYLVGCPEWRMSWFSGIAHRHLCSCPSKSSCFSCPWHSYLYFRGVRLLCITFCLQVSKVRSCISLGMNMLENID